MIQIKRGSYPVDSVMDNRKTKELEKLLKDLCDGKKPLKFKPLWSNDKVKTFLYQSQYGKCCYCERKRDQTETDVEHFRPKATVKENKKHSGYWWLAYSWDNLLISCKKCNNHKGTNFPLKDESKRAFSNKDNIKKEEPVLINPLTENPEIFIEYDIPEDNKDDPLMIKAKAIGKCEKGDKTINELTGINDRELLLERAENFRNCHILYKYFLALKNSFEAKKEIYKEVKKKMDSSNQFAGLARFYFNKVLNLNDL